MREEMSEADPDMVESVINYMERRGVCLYSTRANEKCQRVSEWEWSEE